MENKIKSNNVEQRGISYSEMQLRGNHSTIATHCRRRSCVEPLELQRLHLVPGCASC